jgi:hypothetical protein
MSNDGTPGGNKLMKWTETQRSDGRIEYICEHGVGHGNHIHGCCVSNCCSRDDYPGRNKKMTKWNLRKLTKSEWSKGVMTDEKIYICNPPIGVTAVYIRFPGTDEYGILERKSNHV